MRFAIANPNLEHMPTSRYRRTNLKGTNAQFASGLGWCYFMCRQPRLETQGIRPGTAAPDDDRSQRHNRSGVTGIDGYAGATLGANIRNCRRCRTVAPSSCGARQLRCCPVRGGTVVRHDELAMWAWTCTNGYSAASRGIRRHSVADLGQRYAQPPEQADAVQPLNVRGWAPGSLVSWLTVSVVTCRPAAAGTGTTG
jgi:hypothetical protein